MLLITILSGCKYVSCMCDSGGADIGNTGCALFPLTAAILALGRRIQILLRALGGPRGFPPLSLLVTTPPRPPASFTGGQVWMWAGIQ